MRNLFLVGTASAAILCAVGCNHTGSPVLQAVNDGVGQTGAASENTQTHISDPLTGGQAQVSTPQTTRSSLALTAGTTIPVRIEESISTRYGRAGDAFTATLDEPLVQGDRVLVPKGTTFRGHIVSAYRSGRFKGRAVLSLSLDSFDLKGRVYPLRTVNASRFSGGHKKRNWLWIGGGSGGGAAAGAIAGGGPAALIGAGAGAAAGTVGAAVTGRRDVTLPAETRVTFRLDAPLSLGT